MLTSIGRVAAIVALSAMVPVHAAGQATRPPPPQIYSYDGWEFSEVIADCPTFRLNWADPMGFHAAVQVEGPNGFTAVYRWTQPHYDEWSDQIRMELEAVVLGGQEFGFLSLAATSGAGMFLARAQLGIEVSADPMGPGGRTDQGSVAVNPADVGNPDTYSIVMSWGDGGGCDRPWLAEYFFHREVSGRPAPAPTPAPPPSPSPPAYIRGTWSWTASCAEGTYEGFLAFGDLEPGGGFSGSFSTVGGGGTMSDGRLVRDQISFTRTLGGQQYWSGRLSGSSITDGTIRTASETCSFSAAKM